MDKFKDYVSSNYIKLKISLPFVPNSSTAHQSSSMFNISSSYSPTSAKDRLNQNTAEDDSLTHLLEKSMTVSIPETDHTLSSLTCNQSEIPPVIPNSSKEISPKKSQPNLSNTVNLPKGFIPLPTHVLSEVS